MASFVNFLPNPTVAILLFALLASVTAIGWWMRDGNELALLRERFILGIPWGTIVVVCWLVFVYLIVQDGWAAWDRPVTYPYTAWSYFYPLGQLLAGFSHQGPGHFLGNLLGAIVLGSLAEYAWGHYPSDDRDRPRHPWVRAVVWFPVVVFVVTLVTVLFAWGPVIGFSGTVFAFAGFSVIHYPIPTVLALLGQSVLALVARAITGPVVTHELAPAVEPPSWVGVAVQGHALGFLLGALVGLGLLYRRTALEDHRPVRVWFGIVIVGASMGLWTIWGAREVDVFVLYRGAGVAALLVLALLLTAATRARARPVAIGLTSRQLIAFAVCLPLVAMAFAAVPMGLQTVVPPETADTTVVVEDYEVYYASNASMAWRPGVVGLPLPNTTVVTRSGLFISSEARQMHIRPISSEELAREGATTLTVGGVSWRTDLTVERTGWTPTNNDSVYRVTIAYDDDERTVYASPSRAADVRVTGHRIAVTADADGFGLQITDRNGVSHRSRLPEAEEPITVGNLTIRRDGDDLIAEDDGTVVTVAKRD